MVLCKELKKRRTGIQLALFIDGGDTLREGNGKNLIVIWTTTKNSFLKTAKKKIPKKRTMNT